MTKGGGRRRGSGKAHLVQPISVRVLILLAADGQALDFDLPQPGRRLAEVEGVRLLISHANGLSSDAYFPFDINLFDLRGHGANPPGKLIDHNVAMMAQDSRRIVRAVIDTSAKSPGSGFFVRFPLPWRSCTPSKRTPLRR